MRVLLSVPLYAVALAGLLLVLTPLALLYTVGTISEDELLRWVDPEGIETIVALTYRLGIILLGLLGAIVTLLFCHGLGVF